MVYFNNNVDEITKEVVYESIELIELCGIELPNRIEIKKSNLTKAYGYCKTKPSDTSKCEISISSHIITKEALQNTIIHELLHGASHLISLYCGHNGIWLDYANKMNKRYKFLNIKEIGYGEGFENSIKSSKKTYFTKEEYEEDGGKYLVALTIEGESTPRWFVKRGNKIDKNLDKCSFKGKKLIRL